MASWDPADRSDPGVDLRLARHGFVSVFGDAALASTRSWLLEHGYHVVSIDTAEWRTPTAMHDSLAAALDFPDYLGRSLDAFNDCLSELAAGGYGWPSTRTGLVLELQNYDSYAARSADQANALIEIFHRQAIHAALYGNRLLCLVGTSDPAFDLAPVGTAFIVWAG
jgi:RNAse (barnase) inhibitor barstar